MKIQPHRKECRDWRNAVRIMYVSYLYIPGGCHDAKSQLPPSRMTIEKLKKLSEKTGLSVAELIRRAVDEYLKKELAS